MDKNDGAPGEEPADGRLNGADPAPEASLLRAAPGLARIAVGAWWRTAEWTVGSTARAASRVTRAAVSGESAGELLDGAHAELREQMRRLSGMVDGDGAPAQEANADPRVTDRDHLRHQGAQLLDLSADVDLDEETHPAYERILSELAPDEARVLRLLARSGDQAAIDVRTWRPLGVGEETVAPGLSMIGRNAGCRHSERLAAYLNNLFRLGLIWFSREPVDDLAAYQVLEAQPASMEAAKEAGRARFVRRSIRLTPFGSDFCQTALPG